jgi:hypothetical protein
MNTIKRTMCGLWGALLGCASVSSAAVLSPNLPQVQTYAGIPYLSGGVGMDEREALRSMSEADNLQLIFAARNGEYLSDVEVVITTSNGQKVLYCPREGIAVLETERLSSGKVGA